MKKVWSFVVLLLCVFVGLVALRGVDIVNRGNGAFSAEAIQKGYLHLLLMKPAFWGSFPSLPGSIQVYLDIPALVVTGFILVMMLYTFGKLQKLSSMKLSWICLISGFIPYALGLWALSGSGLSMAYAERWLVIMTLGLLYSTAVGTFFALMELINLNLFRVLAKVPVPKVSFSTSS